MNFIDELAELREKEILVRQEAANRKDMNDFKVYLFDLIKSGKDKIQTAFKHYVKNNPYVENPSIVREYAIDSKMLRGMTLFFNHEAVKDFIRELISQEFNGFHITIKDSSKLIKASEYKITVRFAINFTST